MSTYICKCGRRVQKSSNADNTRNRLKGYGPGHECYGCPYVLSWGTYEWNEEAKNLEQKTKGYECRMSKTLSYASQFIGSTKDKCTCSVVSLDFDFLEEISAWIKETFTAGELTGGFSRGEIRTTEYCHNGRYQYTLYCAQNKKGIAAKAASFEQFFNPDGSRKDMTPQQEMEKVLADIKKAKEATECATAPNADAAVTTAENAVLNAATATPTTSENGADASALTQEASPQGCESGPTVPAESFSAGEAVGGTSSPNLTLPANTKTPTAFDYAGLDTQTVDVLHMAESQYSKGKKMAETGLRWMVNAVSMAHDALCSTVVPQWDNSKHGNRGEDSFRAWCASIGVSKSSAYRLLSVSEKFSNIEVDGKSILDVQPATLLYEAAKPSAPAELVAQIKSGDITTHKQYQEALAQIKAEKERADAAEAERDKLLGAQNRAAWAESHIQDVEAQRDAALADVQGLTEQNAKLKERADSAEAREEEAWKLQSKSEAKAKDAETELEAVTADLNGLYDRAAQAEARNTALLDERAEYVQRIKELESRPIEVMHDPEETDRLAHQYAYGIAADMTEELRTKNNQQSQTIAALQKELEAARSTNGYDPQSDLETVCACIGSMEQMWGTALPAYERLSGKDLRTATDTLQDVIGRLYGDMARTAEDGED